MRNTIKNVKQTNHYKKGGGTAYEDSGRSKRTDGILSEWKC